MSHPRPESGDQAPAPPPPEPPPDQTAAPGGLRGARLALAHARRAAAHARLQSQLLRARAAGVSRDAAAVRDLAETHRALWERWHRAWAGLTADGGARLLRVCVYCGGAVLEPADPTTPGAWGPVPPWVHDRLRADALGVRRTHGACPSCADAWLAAYDRAR